MRIMRAPCAHVFGDQKRRDVVVCFYPLVLVVVREKIEDEDEWVKALSVWLRPQAAISD